MKGLGVAEFPVDLATLALAQKVALRLGLRRLAVRKGDTARTAVFRR